MSYVRDVFKSFELTRTNLTDYVLPRKTGNLQDRATLIEQLGPDLFKVYISETIAPYASMINDTPKIRKDFAGYPHYFDKFKEHLVNKIVELTGGVVE